MLIRWPHHFIGRMLFFMPFVKGHSGFTGKHHSEKSKRKMSLAHLGQIPWNTGKKRLEMTGKNHPLWKGIKAGYHSFHIWLYKHYGKPNQCQSYLVGMKCRGISKKFEWALLKGEKHDHKRENYIMLCTSCHRKYDMTDEKRKKISAISKRRARENGKFSLGFRDLVEEHTHDWQKTFKRNVWKCSGCGLLRNYMDYD